jgi:hypothetical protein
MAYLDTLLQDPHILAVVGPAAFRRGATYLDEDALLSAPLSAQDIRGLLGA